MTNKKNSIKVDPEFGVDSKYKSNKEKKRLCNSNASSFTPNEEFTKRASYSCETIAIKIENGKLSKRACL
jgi:hypothetical protein